MKCTVPWALLYPALDPYFLFLFLLETKVALEDGVANAAFSIKIRTKNGYNSFCVVNNYTQKATNKSNWVSWCMSWVYNGQVNIIELL